MHYGIDRDSCKQEFRDYIRSDLQQEYKKKDFYVNQMKHICPAHLKTVLAPEI